MQIGFISYLLFLAAIFYAMWGGYVDYIGRFLISVALICILSRLFLAGIYRASIPEEKRGAVVYPLLLANGLLASFAWVGGLSFILYNFSFGRIDNLISGISSNMWGMLFIGLVPAGLVLQTRNLARAVARGLILSLVEFFSVTVFLLGVVILTSLHRLSSESMLGFWILSLTLNAAMSIVVIWIKTNNRKAVSLRLLRDSLLTGFKPFWVDFLFTLSYFTPLIICSQFLEWRQTGVFALTLVLSEATWRMALFARNRNPDVSDQGSDNSPDFNAARFAFLVQWGIKVGSVVIIGGALLFGLLFHTLLSDYWLLLFLVPGMIFYLINRLFSDLFEKAGDYFLLISAGAIAFAVNFDLSLMLTGELGLAGAGLAFFLIQSLLAGFYIAVYRKRVGVGARDLLWGGKTSASARDHE